METDRFQLGLQTDGLQRQVGTRDVQKSHEIPESQPSTVPPIRKKNATSGDLELSVYFELLDEVDFSDFRSF